MFVICFTCVSPWKTPGWVPQYSWVFRKEVVFRNQGGGDAQGVRPLVDGGEETLPTCRRKWPANERGKVLWFIDLNFAPKWREKMGKIIGVDR